MSEPSQPRIREGQAEVSGAARRRRHRLIQICRAYDAARAIDDANQMIESTDQTSFVRAGQAYVRDCKYDKAFRRDVGRDQAQPNACVIPAYKLPLKNGPHGARMSTAVPIAETILVLGVGRK